MEKELNEKQLVIKVKDFTIIHKDGSVEITDEMISDIEKKTLLLALKSTNNKYKLQYTIT